MTEDAEESTELEWSAFYDAEGTIYYYNATTGESSWEAPEKYNPPPAPDAPQEAEDNEATGEPGTSDKGDEGYEEQEAPSGSSSDWMAYEDAEGRTYYYNAVSGETQWDKPEGYVAPAEEEYAGSHEGAKPSSSSPSHAVGNEDYEKTEDEEASNEQIERTIDREPSPVEDPAEKRFAEAEKALKQKDSVLEPGCIGYVEELVTSERTKPETVIQTLIDSFQGQTSVCGLLGRWLADLKSKDSQGPMGAAFQSVANEIRETAQNVVNQIAKERFTKTGGDSILTLSKSEVTFLEDMMKSDRWRKLLIDLSATNKDSALLMYCLREISNKGHHREIAKRINVSDSFLVFNAMLQSELAVVGKAAISANSDVDTSSIGLEEIVSDLRRTCTSTAYTYLYAIEVLRHLVATAKVRARSSKSTRFRRATRKWERLYQDLDNALMDPSNTASLAATSPLFRKRRLDVALTVSELHQRQRRRRKVLPDGDDNADNRPQIETNQRLNDLETGLLNFLRRHYIGTRVDDAVLDAMLRTDLNLNIAGLNAPDQTGEVLISCPLAVRALLSHMFKPGSSRNSSATKNKCARLIALATLAAEKQALEEDNEEEGLELSSESEEVSLTRMLVQGSELCEQVENMVSFLVTTVEAGNSADKAAKTPGQVLCEMCLKCAPLAQGVMIWVSGISKGPEFVNSPAYPTFCPSILSLVRIIGLRHPCTRADAVDVAFAFLQHSSTSEISYQKMNAIKEQSFRLLLFLLVKGEAVSVLRNLTTRLQDKDALKIDASLMRYFVGGLLDVVRPPLSLPFVRLLGSTLKAPKCVEAIRSAYFGEAKKQQLSELLASFQETVSVVHLSSGAAATADDRALVSSLISTYTG